MNNYKLRIVLLALFIGATEMVWAQCGTVNLPAFIHACKGGTILMPTTVTSSYNVYSVQWNPTTGLSDGTILTPTATLGVTSISYLVNVTFIKNTNLISNGDFSLGNNVFTTDYYPMDGASSTHTSSHDSMAVDLDPSLYDASKFPVISDHTGGGNMLIVDGATDSNKNVWCETINVNPTTFYVFTFWANLFNVPDPYLKLVINGTVVKGFDLSGPAGQWVKYSYVWNSTGTSGLVNVCLYDTTQSDAGNDFALDDISMYELCSASGGTSVLLSDFKPVENFIAKVCKKDVTFFGADSVNPNISSHNWDFGDGFTDTGITVKHTFPAEGSYTVVFKETDKYGCLDSATAKVGIITTTKNIHASRDTIICKGATVQLLATGGKTYAWIPKAGLNDSSVADPKATPSVPTVYVVNAVDSQGCTGADTVNIAFFPPPDLKITPNTDPVTCERSSVQLYVSGARKFIWQPGLLCDNNTSSHPIVTPTKTTTFYVYGTDGKGCDATDSITVICLADSIYIPNAFTPNGDGHNDVIAPTPYCNFLMTEFVVYNRWGQEMFKTTKVGDAWDGKLAGQPQPIGVYVYSVKGYRVNEGKVDNIQSVIKGNITLLR